MFKISIVIAIQLVIIFCCYVPGTLYADELLTPESFTKRITLQPAVTKIIEEDDLILALKKLNILHGVMAEDGWELFTLIEFIDDEHFEGFFVTYKKKKE